MRRVNEVLAPRWAESVQRLRLGVQPRDALARPGPLGGIGLHLESVPRPWVIPRPARDRDDIGLPGVPASPTGRFALRLARDGGPDRLEIRLVDPGRRYVPRRLSVPVPGYAQVLAGDAAHDDDPAVPLVQDPATG